jgi:cyclohexanone monooxygenase
MHSRGFPNCFIMGPQQSAFTVNYPHMLDEQAKHIAYLVRHALDRDARTLEASEAGEEQWVQTIIAFSRMGRDFLEACTPGYYNNEGNLSNLAAQNSFFGGGSILFFNMLKDWREKGDFQGLEVG